MTPLKLVNTFKVGADPELAALNPPNLINTQQGRRVEPTGYFGWDHGGYVLEPHPEPNLSVREVCHNIRKCLDYIWYQFPDYKFRGGAYVKAPERGVPLGGHVHLDFPRPTPPQIVALDMITESFEKLDILPEAEGKVRFADGGYGRKGDVRAEHGHMEYRSMCSWLFSPKAAMLCMTGAKLASFAPQSLEKPFTSSRRLKEWFERFKGSDDDARWILDKGYFDESLEADPDASVMAVWKASKLRGKALGEIIVNKKVKNAVGNVVEMNNRPRNEGRVAERIRAIQADQQRREREAARAAANNFNDLLGQAMNNHNNW